MPNNPGNRPALRALQSAAFSSGVVIRLLPSAPGHGQFRLGVRSFKKLLITLSVNIAMRPFRIGNAG